MSDPQQLVRTIRTLIDKGDKASEKAEQFYIAAGQHLKTLKGQTPDWATWEAILKEKCGIGKSRASQLMMLADGRKTLSEVRSEEAEKKRRQRAEISPGRPGEAVPAEVDFALAGDMEHCPRELIHVPPRGWEPDEEVESSIEDEIDPENYRTAFLLRADQAARFAVYSGPVSGEVLEAARAAARAWEVLIGKMEKEIQ